MPKPLQIRSVPDDVIDVLKRRAAREGLSLSAYALRVLTYDACTPTLREVLTEAEPVAPAVAARDISAILDQVWAERVDQLVRPWLDDRH
jgi:plasmid stability protein